MLGALARAIGLAGADIVTIEVLERSLTHAVDDVVLELSPGRDVSDLTIALSGLLGVQVLALHPAPDSAGHPDLDLLTALAANPARGLITFTDMLPAVFRATWALTRSATDLNDAVVHASLAVPPFALSLRPAGHRARELSTSTTDPAISPAAAPAAGVAMATCPVGGSAYLVILGRDIGPRFHPVELFRLECLAAVVDAMLGNIDRAGARTSIDVPVTR